VILPSAVIDVVLVALTRPTFAARFMPPKLFVEADAAFKLIDLAVSGPLTVSTGVSTADTAVAVSEMEGVVLEPIEPVPVVMVPAFMVKL
jgi:hypothetical protein